jgi:large repetitive protein
MMIRITFIFGLLLANLTASAQSQPEIFTAPPQSVIVRALPVNEGNAGTTPVLFRIERTAVAGAATLRLDYSTQDGSANAGSDYVAKQGSITLSPLQPTAEITVLVNGDMTIEANESFRLILRDGTATSALPVAVGAAAIINDDGVAPPPGATGFYVRGESVREGNVGTTALRFTVFRSNPQATGAMTLNYATESESATAGSDFEFATGQVTLTSQQPSATFTVSVLGDTVVEPLERFRVQVADPILAIPPQIAYGTIFDDDGITPPPPSGVIAIPFDALAIEPASGESEARLAVRLLRPATELLRFSFAANPGATATAGVDFIGPSTGTLEFAVGDLVKQITFQIRADGDAEQRESVSYTLIPAVGVQMPRTTATLAIIDRPAAPPPVQASAVIIPCRPFVKEDEGTAKLLVKRVADTSAALAIKFKTEDGSALAGSDYTETTGDLTWAAGNAEIKRIEVPIVDDELAESPERFQLRLTDVANAPLPGRTSAPIVILDSMDQILNEDFNELCTFELTSAPTE